MSDERRVETQLKKPLCFNDPPRPPLQRSCTRHTLLYKLQYSVQRTGYCTQVSLSGARSQVGKLAFSLHTAEPRPEHALASEHK